MRRLAAGLRIGPVGALALATVIGGAVRFSTVGLQSYWDDEAFTVDLVRQPFVDMLSTVLKTERTPHLYYVLAWGWTHVFGSGEWGLRSLSALLGTATIPVAYLAARTVVSRRGAVLAAFLVATNPFLVWYSQEARAYALFAFLCALSFVAFGRALRGDQRGLLWWIVIAIAAVATHYFAIFVIGAEAAWLLHELGIRRSTVIATAVVGVACCALVPVVMRQFSEHGEPIGGSLRTRVAQIPVHLVVGAGVTAVTWGKIALAAMVLLLGFAAWALVARSPKDARRGGAIAVGVALTGVLVPVVGAFGGADYFKTLYFVATIPLFAIAVGQGFASTRGGTAAAAAATAIGLSIISYVAVTPWLQRPDLRGVATSLGSPQVDRAIVLAPTARVGVYMHSLVDVPAGGDRVREVDFVALPTKSAGKVPHPPRNLPREFTLVGFALWRHVFGERYTILRYRAPSPELVTEAELLGDSFREWPRNLTTVVEQRAGR